LGASLTTAPSCDKQIGQRNNFSDSRSLIPSNKHHGNVDFSFVHSFVISSFAEWIAGRCATDANHFTLLQFGEMSVHWSPILKSEGIFHSVLKVSL